MDIYYIHDNFTRPFRIHVTNEKIAIYVDEDMDKFFSHLLTYYPKKIFIGESPDIPASLDYGPKYDGNSILLKIDDTEYIFIGKEIYSFKTETEIIEYVSPIGGNDAPYPYAIDIGNKYYLMVEDVILTNVPEDYKNQPYEYFYQTHSITLDMGIYSYRKTYVENFKDIDELYVGNEKYGMCYHPFPGKNYDRITKMGQKSMSLRLINGELKKINKEQYVKLIEEYGNIMGFLPMKNINMIHKRIC